MSCLIIATCDVPALLILAAIRPKAAWKNEAVAVDYLASTKPDHGKFLADNHPGVQRKGRKPALKFYLPMGTAVDVYVNSLENGVVQVASATVSTIVEVSLSTAWVYLKDAWLHVTPHHCLDNGCLMTDAWLHINTAWLHSNN